MKMGWLKMGLLGAGLMLMPTPAQAAKKVPSKVTGVVNLNQATPDQLKMLPGVKDKAASSIIAYREKQPFTRIEELAKIKGFSKKRFEKLKPHLAVKGETTLKVEGHPGPHPKAEQAKKASVH